MMKNPHPSRSRLYVLAAALGLMLLLFLAALYDAQILHGSENRAVPPRDRPTVPMAEAASNSASISGTWSMQQIRMPPMRKNRRYRRKIAQALWSAPSCTRRP